MCLFGGKNLSVKHSNNKTTHKHIYNLTKASSSNFNLSFYFFKYKNKAKVNLLLVLIEIIWSIVIFYARVVLFLYLFV